MELLLYFSQLLDGVNCNTVLAPFILREKDKKLVWDYKYSVESDPFEDNFFNKNLPIKFGGFIPFYCEFPFEEVHLKGGYKFNFYKERLFYTDEVCRVYRNLNKNCYSIMQRGKVVAHADTFTLRNANFIVGENGRQRCLSEKRKNVHAYIEGYFGYSRRGNSGDLKKVSYNPYYRGHFFDEEKNPVESAQFAYLKPEGVFCE